MSHPLPTTSHPAPRASPGTTPRTPAALTVAAVVPRGAVVGVDDSELVRGLLDAVVGAGPALVGTASLAALAALAATHPARAGDLRIRLFGGELRRSTGMCAGPQSVRAVTATACDVALVGGRRVAADLWVPEQVREGRCALLLAARRAYAVLAADDPPWDPQCHPGWTRLAAVADFDGVLTVGRPRDPAQEPTAA